ncbi:hypothetical protein UK82_28630 [Frankia sp. ACN1ag]|nr:hypothetical protein UK82_28630 [Frankia sp. ACN1ag]
MDQEQLDDGTVAGAECTRCGALLVPGTTATGAEECAACLYGLVWPERDGWSDEDDAVPPQCVGCGDALIPGVTALPPGTPGRRERCQSCAVIGQCRGCGDAIIGGYNDVPGEAYQRERCRDCAPDPVLVDSAGPGPDAYDSRDTIL